jgi:hypothetical protein
MLVLPIGMLQSLPGLQIEALLLHELAHVRGRDPLIHLLQRAVETLLFYHPAVWWVSEQIRRERVGAGDLDGAAAAAQADALPGERLPDGCRFGARYAAQHGVGGLGPQRNSGLTAHPQRNA